MHDHNFFTSQIVGWTKKFFDSPGLDIADDTQDIIAGARPEQLNAWVNGKHRKCLPDFYARDSLREPSLYVVGEAKTGDDFISRHDDAEIQMNVMINFLKNKPEPILIYSIPNKFKDRVINELNTKIYEFKANRIRVEVIDQYFKYK